VLVRCRCLNQRGVRSTESDALLGTGCGPAHRGT
jgi:hypothetical protein